MYDKVRVTVCCLTFNHELYVREALEGFVSQNTSFDFEVIVHDDASTDGTADIIKEYERRYPSLIKGIYQKENQYSKHRSIFCDIVSPVAHGDYIAYCEGDDFWISSKKLQVQFEYMEAHPECALCGCGALQIRAEDGCCFGMLGISDKEKILSGGDMFDAGKTFLPSCTLFYRKSVLLESHEKGFRDGCPVGDYPGRVFAGTRGTVYYSPEIMAVKREGSVGSYSVRVVANTQKSISDNDAMILWLQSKRQDREYKLYLNAIDKEICRLTEKRKALDFVDDCSGKSLRFLIKRSSRSRLRSLNKQWAKECVKRILKQSGNAVLEWLTQKWLNYRFRKKRNEASIIVAKVKQRSDIIESVNNAWL